MSKLLSRKWLLIVLAAALFVMAGCQAVGGVDLNSVLKKSLKVTSSESKQTFELKMDFQEEALEELDEEERLLLELVSNLKVELNDVKYEDSNHMSLEGKFIFNQEQSIGFAMQISSTTLAVQLEGAKQPFVLDLTADMLTEEELSELGMDEASVAELGVKIMDAVSGYAIDNLPNPKSIKVAPAFESINGITTSVMHASAELDGAEIWSLLGDYIDALLADRKGMDAMLNELITILMSNEALAEELDLYLNTGELDAPTKEDLVKEAADAITEALTELRLNMDDSVLGDMAEALFNKALTVKADVYVDSNLNIRKQGLDVNFTIDEESELSFLPIRSIQIKTMSEIWNVNGEVKADKPVITEKSIDLYEMDMMEGYEVVNLFKDDSMIYDILKNKLHLTHQSYVAFSNDYYNAPIIVPGYITIVPIRDVADVFGAETTYDAKTKTITVHDIATGTIIKTTVGSDIANINGKNVKWSFPTTIIDGTGYVAARSLSEALNASIEWTKLYEDVKLLTIEREL